MNIKEIKEENGTDGKWILLIGLAHLLCCGLPFLLLSGFSIIAVFQNNIVISVILGIAVLFTVVWLIKNRVSRKASQQSDCIDGVCKTHKTLLLP